MEELRAQLIEQARDRHKKIYPCSNFAAFDECFTITGNRVFFWFNTEDNSTHILTADCSALACA